MTVNKLMLVPRIINRKPMRLPKHHQKKAPLQPAAERIVAKVDQQLLMVTIYLPRQHSNN